MAGTLHLGRQFDPLGFQPERIEFSPHDGAYLAYTVVIHRATGDIDGLLEQRDGVFSVRVDPLDHALFVGVERRGLDLQRAYERRDAGKSANCHSCTGFLIRSANVARRLS